MHRPNPFYHIEQRLQFLEQELIRLRQENEMLRKKIDQLKPVQVEKIEYKVHELHVETLSGTLNIGLTANGEEAGIGEVIEKMVDNNQSQIVLEEQEEESS
ncbi:MAG: spore germination protein GerPC [Thermoactinomyces sp.]